MMRSRGSNASKVKYHLPVSKYQQQNISRQGQTSGYSYESKSNSKMSSKKQSVIFAEAPTVFEDQLSIEVLGINEEDQKDPTPTKSTNKDNMDSSKKDCTFVKSKKQPQEELMARFPEGKQKQEFYEFLSTLKDDLNYQNTITMFTIMYFYDKKKNKDQ